MTTLTDLINDFGHITKDIGVRLQKGEISDREANLEYALELEGVIKNIKEKVI